MTTAEVITNINARYYADMRRAHAHPRTTKRGAIGVRRARMVVQARRRRAERLRAAGVRPWR